jgi:hypothetical protein
MREQPPLRAEGLATTMPSTSARSKAIHAAALRSDTRYSSSDLGRRWNVVLMRSRVMDPLSAIGICTLTLGTLTAALYVARREACHQRTMLAEHDDDV